MNKNGVSDVGFAVLALVIFLGSFAAGKTVENGTFKKNMNVIKCKMANKGEAYCNALYNYKPNK